MDEDKEKKNEGMETIIDHTIMDETLNTQTQHGCLGLPLPFLMKLFPCFINRAEVLVTLGL